MSETLGRHDPHNSSETRSLSNPKASDLRSRYSTDTYEDNFPSKHDSAISAAGVITHDDSVSKRERVKNLGHEAKTRAKRFLRKRRLSPEEVEAEEDEDHDNPYVDIQGNAAFEPGRPIKNNRITVGGTTDRTIGGVYAAAKAVLHPGTAIKRKAATKIAVQDRPYLSQNADLEYLEAQDNLARAMSSCENNSGDDERLERHRDKVQELDDLRESKKVAWITSRHVERAVVVVRRELPPPNKEEYYVINEQTGERRLDIKAWLVACFENGLKAFAINAMGHIDTAGAPAFDRDVMALYLERILIASAPWQHWFFALRQLYRWEDPGKTGRWLGVWLIVWYLDYNMSFILAYVVFIVLQNKFDSKRIEKLRASYDRALDQGTAALKFNELIHKHGTDKWLDPLLDQIGPKLQIQVSDVADFLETLNNFYHWKVPDKTWATLFCFGCAISIGALTPSGYSIKVVWLFCLAWFFFSRPVASMYPAYRHAVNALGWMFWDIPNDPDWSLMYLRGKAQATRERLIAQKVEEKYNQETNGPNPAAQGYFGSDYKGEDTDMISDSDAESWHSVESSSSILDGLDVMSFRCHEAGMTGRIVIYTGGIRFERLRSLGRPPKEIWRRKWISLVEIRKVKSTTIPKLLSTDGLHLTFLDGIEVELVSVQRRDRAFNCIVGFSGLPFQVLRPMGPAAGEDKYVGDKHDDARQKAK